MIILIIKLNLLLLYNPQYYLKYLYIQIYIYVVINIYHIYKQQKSIYK